MPSHLQALLDAGYTFLDVRTELESNAKGKIRGSVHIPCAAAKQAYDPASGQMVRAEGRGELWAGRAVHSGASAPTNATVAFRSVSGERRARAILSQVAHFTQLSALRLRSVSRPD